MEESRLNIARNRGGSRAVKEKEEKDKRGDEEPRDHVAKIARLYRGKAGEREANLKGLERFRVCGRWAQVEKHWKEPHLCRRYYGC